MEIEGDGALGFWKALPRFTARPGNSACWVNKTANLLNQMTGNLRASAKWHPQDIRTAGKIAPPASAAFASL